MPSICLCLYEHYKCSLCESSMSGNYAFRPFSIYYTSITLRSHLSMLWLETLPINYNLAQLNPEHSHPREATRIYNLLSIFEISRVWSLQLHSKMENYRGTSIHKYHFGFSLENWISQISVFFEPI